MWKGTHRDPATEMSVRVLDVRVWWKTVSHIGDRPAGYNIQGCRRHHMSNVDSYEHTDGTDNLHDSYFNDDIHRGYDCYELPCDRCEECKRAVSRGDAFTVCPACGKALQDTNIQYTCKCVCVIEPCATYNSKPFVAGFASQNILLHAIEAEEDMI